VITVVDPEAARVALAAGAMGCPQAGCSGVLRPWSAARPRTVTTVGGVRVRLAPGRARCRSCRVTHVLLPAWTLPRRAYGVEVIGAALSAAAQGAGYRRAAVAAAAPVSTVKAWLRAVARGAAALSAVAVAVTRSMGGDTGGCWAPGTAPDPPIGAALRALGVAARSLAHAAGLEPGTRARSLTGVDHLALITRRHRCDLFTRLRLGDPCNAGMARPWEQVVMVTAGRLLTSAMA